MSFLKETGLKITTSKDNTNKYLPYAIFYNSELCCEEKYLIDRIYSQFSKQGYRYNFVLCSIFSNYVVDGLFDDEQLAISTLNGLVSKKLKEYEDKENKKIISRTTKILFKNNEQCLDNK